MNTIDRAVFSERCLLWWGALTQDEQEHWILVGRGIVAAAYRVYLKQCH